MCQALIMHIFSSTCKHNNQNDHKEEARVGNMVLMRGRCLGLGPWQVPPGVAGKMIIRVTCVLVIPRCEREMTTGKDPDF